MRALVRVEARGGAGKIEALRARLDREDWLAAECLLAALGVDTGDAEDPEFAPKHAGALFIVRGFRELTVIRKALTTAPE